MDIRKFGNGGIVEIYHNAETEKPIITISTIVNSIVHDGARFLFMPIFGNKDSTKNVLVANNTSDERNIIELDDTIFKDRLSVFTIHEIDKYQSAHIYIYDESEDICFVELVYYERTNTLNVYLYKNNNPTKLISSIILLD